MTAKPDIIALTATCWVTFVRKGDVMQVHVFDRVAPTTPIYAFVLNRDAWAKVRNLAAGEWSIPGMNVKELAAFMRDGSTPPWVGKP